MLSELVDLSSGSGEGGVDPDARRSSGFHKASNLLTKLNSSPVAQEGVSFVIQLSILLLESPFPSKLEREVHNFKGIEIVGEFESTVFSFNIEITAAGYKLTKSILYNALIGIIAGNFLQNFDSIEERAAFFGETVILSNR